MSKDLYYEYILVLIQGIGLIETLAPDLIEHAESPEIAERAKVVLDDCNTYKLELEKLINMSFKDGEKNEL